MKKYLPLVVVVIVIVAIAGIAVANKDDNKVVTPPPAPTSDTNQSDNSTANNPSPTTPSPQSSNSSSVSIANMSFSPATLTVKKGTSVTWTNNDSVVHTVTATTNKEHGPNSGNISPGKTYSFTFNDEGTFNYFCEVHPSMTGKVTVTE
jgi:plastocyanin